MNGSGGKDVPELIPVRRIHNYIYCPQLMYFQFVENIFIDDAAVTDGETVHRRVEVPSACDFPEEIVNSNTEALRSVALESSELGIVGVIDLLKKNEDGCTWTLYDYKRGSAARDSAGRPCAKEADEVQVQMYILLASRHHFCVTRGMVYYAEEKRCVEVVPYRDEKALHALIDAVRRAAAGDLPPPRKIERLIAGYGYRLQASVFFCRLSPLLLARMKQELTAIINLRQDQCIVIDLGEQEDVLNDVIVIGKKIVKIPKITFI